MINNLQQKKLLIVLSESAGRIFSNQTGNMVLNKCIRMKSKHL